MTALPPTIETVTARVAPAGTETFPLAWISERSNWSSTLPAGTFGRTKSPFASVRVAGPLAPTRTVTSESPTAVPRGARALDVPETTFPDTVPVMPAASGDVGVSDFVHAQFRETTAARTTEPTAGANRLALFM